jgi:hypothetical protein
MASVGPNCRRHSHKGGGVYASDKRRVDSKFLTTLSPGRVGRMLVWLDVATRWKREASVDVVNEQHVKVLEIQNYDIRHQVAIRSGRL